MIILIMGVSGCGKTTVGKGLSEYLNIPYYDADDFHPESNINKMSQKIRLQDEDRYPWLEILSEKIYEWNNSSGAVLGCSALKRKYREILQHKVKDQFNIIYLKGNYELIYNRIKSRDNHFMPPDLLKSQFDDLEEPDKNEAVIIYANQNVDNIIKEIILKLNIKII